MSAPKPPRPGARRRDRHGRGLRGQLVPPTVAHAGRLVRVPLSQTRSDRFDDLVRDVIEALEVRFADRLAGVEFAVEDVPPIGPAGAPTYDGVVADETAGGPVPLGRLLPEGPLTPDGVRAPARVVVYRRPLEARAADRADLAELVQDVVVDQVARLLGLDPDDVDPQQLS